MKARSRGAECVPGAWHCAEPRFCGEPRAAVTLPEKKALGSLACAHSQFLPQHGARAQLAWGPLWRKGIWDGIPGTLPPRDQDLLQALFGAPSELSLSQDRDPVALGVGTLEPQRVTPRPRVTEIVPVTLPSHLLMSGLGQLTLPL